MEAISGNEAVVVIDGVIDAANEGVLFALLSEDVKPVVILPFVSHASASLIAKEVWGRVYLPNAESLLTYSRSMRGAKLQKMTSDFELPKISADDALEEARDLSEELERLDLTAEHHLLTAVVFRAIEDLTDEELIERYVAQHLLMCSRCDKSAFEAIAEWSEGDLGLTELSKKLGVYE